MAVSTKRRRTHVVLPDELLQKIDERVGPRHRSEFIEEAVEEKIRHLELVEAFHQFAGSIKDGDVPEWDTPESTARWIDEIRGRCTPDHLSESSQMRRNVT